MEESLSLTIPETIRVLLPDGAVKKMSLEAYVCGVVAAVLAPDAALEAAKALAVAARTFGASTRRHSANGADVCTKRHCQVWQGPSSTSPAVEQTRGIVAMFDGKLIDAFYFEHCDGRTRDAAGVIPNAPSYLRAVSCRCGFAARKGHGIGMCLRGALVMARFGDTFDTILKHYYNGITLETALAPQANEPSTRTRAPRPKSKPVARQAQPANKSAPAKTKAQEVKTPTALDDSSWYPSLRDFQLEEIAVDIQPFESLSQAAPAAKAPPVAPEPVRTEHSVAPPSVLESVSEAPLVPPQPAVVEHLVAPLDAPESMPEALPVFVTTRAEVETPVRWAEPPPLVEELETAIAPPAVVIDRLPGPRLIAGNLARAGVVVTVRDANGNAHVTVSGSAPHHGAGGFEVQVLGDGAYSLAFEGEVVDLALDDETVFVHCSK